MIFFRFYSNVFSEIQSENDLLGNWIQGLQTKGKRVFSQNDEDGVIEEIFDYIGTTNKVYVEFGASDGQECNTRFLREKKGWNVKESLLLDGSYEEPGINLKKVMFWPDNIIELFQKFGVLKHFDFLSVDMDSYDWFTLEKIFDAGFEPRVVIIECNTMFELEDSKTILPPILPGQTWKMWDRTTYQGASMLAIKNLFNRFSYSLVWCNLINCIGIQDKVLGSKIRLPVEEIQQHIQFIKRRSIVLNLCDHLERPMAVISPDGTWNGETDNSQGSPYIRCFLKEYQRGKLIIPFVDPGCNNDLQLYRAYLNYTDQNSANSYRFAFEDIY